LNLDLTEEQALLEKTVREFAETEVRPLAKELDETGHFPRATFQKAAELGLTGIALPEAEGGGSVCLAAAWQAEAEDVVRAFEKRAGRELVELEGDGAGNARAVERLECLAGRQA